MNIFLVSPSEEEIIQLNEEESAHCIRVLGTEAGDKIHMVDGVGGFYIGEIIHADAKACEVKVLERNINFGKRNCHLHIAIAPTKNIDRFEWFLEKATEIGIDEITPLICEHSERREVKMERLNKVIVAAMKQSIKAYLPKLNTSISFNNFVSGQLGREVGSGKEEVNASISHLPSSASQRFICSVEAAKDALLKNLYSTNSNAVILIGPEGDFSKDEIQIAEKSGYKTVSLGDSRLRTETAGIVVCNTIQLMNSH